MIPEQMTETAITDTEVCRNVSKKPTVILIGGAYGSGKSTTAKLIHNHLSSLPEHPLSQGTTTVDYDNLVGDGSTGKDIDLKVIDEARKNTWGYVFMDTIQRRLDEGYDFVLAPGTFFTRERRERYMRELRGRAEVIGLYFMLPMRQTIADIRTSRTDEVRLVNYVRVLDFYRTHNRAFPKEDHSDLLLPEDRSMLPAEFQAMLNRNEQNRRLLATPHEDHLQPDRQWIVLTHRLKPEHLVQVLTHDDRKPLTLRESLYKLG